MKRSIALIYVCLSLYCSYSQDNLNQSYTDQISQYHKLSDSASKSENYEAAASFKLEELKLLLQFNQMNQIAHCGERLGLLYYHLGNYSKSLSCFQKTAQYYESAREYFSYATFSNIFLITGALCGSTITTPFLSIRF